MFRNNPIEMQTFKCLNPFENQHIYYDHLHFMGTLEQGNGWGILIILVTGINFYGL